MTNMIRRVSLAIKGGPGGVGISVLNGSTKESWGAEGGLFVQRKPVSKLSPVAVFQRIATNFLNLLGTAVTALTLNGYDDGDIQVANNSTATVTITLPLASKVGPGYRTRVLTGKVPAAGAGTTVTPNAADKFQGNGFNAKTAGQTLVNTQATSAVGDVVDLVSDGVGIWYVVSKVGTWA